MGARTERTVAIVIALALVPLRARADGEITRAPGAPPRTPIPEPVSSDLSRQYFFLHDNNYFGLLANDGWPPQVKFQISIRFEVLSLGGDTSNFAANVAYTQTSFWDMFAISQSSPFIENDYRPELFFSYRPQRDARYRELQLGVQHQSNGLGQVGTVDLTAESREWNYVFAEARWGIQRDTSPREAWFYVTPGIRGWIPFGATDDLVRYEGYFAAFADIDLRIPTHPDLGRLSTRLVVRQHNLEADVFYPIMARVRCWLMIQFFEGQAERLITAADSVTHLYVGVGFQ